MTVNTELLKKTLAHIEAHPERWDQADWVGYRECGTTHCFAGWTTTLSGAPIDDDDEVQRADLPARLADAQCEYWPAAVGFLHVADAAKYLLGLTTQQADALFREDNTLDDLRRIVAELCNETTEAGAP